VVARIADDTERNDGGPRDELKIFAARKVDGAKFMREAFWIRLGLALCLSTVTCAAAERLDCRIRGGDRKGLESENGTRCGWLGRVRVQLIVTYAGRSSEAFCTFSPRQTEGREYNDTS